MQKRTETIQQLNHPDCSWGGGAAKSLRAGQAAGEKLKISAGFLLYSAQSDTGFCSLVIRIMGMTSFHAGIVMDQNGVSAGRRPAFLLPGKSVKRQVRLSGINSFQNLKRLVFCDKYQIFSKLISVTMPNAYSVQSITKRYWYFNVIL